jgi:V/A-type H+-transporting ATPase subunit I
VISTGLVLNIVNRFRKGDWIGGFLDSYGVAGAIFYWGILGLLLKYTALRERGLVGLTILLVIALPLLAWSIRGPLLHARSRRAGQTQPDAAGGTLTALMESIVEAFEAALSYMANTISFVRLAAYAMSHAAVLIATFVLAREVGSVSTGGGFLSLMVIIGGNLVAIVLEGIIAGVQALRLEYYEFFNKFFSGGGQAFAPFSLERRSGLDGKE